MLLERSFKSQSKSQSWIAAILVILFAGFFLLLLREGKPETYQRIADSIFHNWMAMAVVVAGLVTVRLWDMPRVFRLLSGFLLLLGALIVGLDLIAWAPLWRILAPLHLPQKSLQPLAAVALIAVWVVLCLGAVLRMFVRWIGARYEHHGFAIGAGPLYFYFRRRRAS
jgi:hypothetical protein